MKIVDVRTLFVDQYAFVKVYTDAGHTGLGELGAWAFLEAAAGAVEAFKRYLIGQDPLRIEHHWQTMYRAYHFRGAAIMSAISAIDIALWDIAGKHFGVPAYQLLGGKCRDRARVYYWVRGKTTEALVKGCIEAKKQGFTAVGHLTPFLDSPRDEPLFETHVQKIERAVDSVRRYREAVGDEVDLCIEIHRRLAPAEAIELAQGIAQFHPLFYEDPVLPDNFDSMALVAQHINIPIATGERLHTVQEFEMLLARNAVHYIRPDVCICGGLSHAKKIAALAEAHNARVVPHNPLSPVSTAACIQLAACIPNFALQEHPSAEEKPPLSDVIKTSVTLDKGFFVVPDTPGIGVEVADDAPRKYPFRPREIRARLSIDGSVVDQ
jgi:galactonate dehydratase